MKTYNLCLVPPLRNYFDLHYQKRGRGVQNWSRPEPYWKFFKQQNVLGLEIMTCCFKSHLRRYRYKNIINSISSHLLRPTYPMHLVGTAVISAKNEHISNFCLKFWHGSLWEIFFSCRKIYFKAYLNNQYNWLKNNTSQLSFILGRAELHLNTSEDGSDIHRFSNRKRVSTKCTFEICEYQSHPQVFWKNSNIVLLSLI